MPDRCTCRECRAGDALPDRLQGWPGAWQMLLLAPAYLEGRQEVMTDDDMPEVEALDPAAVVRPLL